MPTLRHTAVAALISLIAGCGGGSSMVQDSAPTHVPVDLAKVPDAIPREEPASRYGNPKTYSQFGITYTTLASSKGYVERGGASWYGTKFHGRRTSSGEPYDMYAMTAAHKTLPLPTYVQVTNLDNGKQVIVRVNDRGPFHGGRIIDLSYAAAARLDMLKKGTAPVEVRAVDARQHTAQLAQTSKPSAEITRETAATTAPQPNNMPTPPPVQPLTAPSKRLFVQVGAFSQVNNANQVKQRLQEAGISSVHVHTENLTDSTLYKVQLGPVQDLQAADTLRGTLEKLGLSQVSYISR